jgi:predicted glycosyltransferase involved in capsule biosynthesis
MVSPIDNLQIKIYIFHKQRREKKENQANRDKRRTRRKGITYSKGCRDEK